MRNFFVIIYTTIPGTSFMVYTEEMNDVLKQTPVEVDPNAFDKATCITNIEYTTDFNKEQDEFFVKYVTKDLLLRNFKEENLSDNSE